MLNVKLNVNLSISDELCQLVEPFTGILFVGLEKKKDKTREID